MKDQKDQYARITLRIPLAVHDKARRKADAEHISLNSYIVRAIEKGATPKGQQ